MDINNLWSDYDLNSKKQNSRCLAVNTILEGKYLVGPVLGQGGFGITYVGYDLNMEAKIAIKEYFPVELVSRDTTTMHGDRVLSLSGEKSVTYKAGLKKYVAEAQNVSQFSEIPGVVSVKDFFYANETAYIVMEFIDGISLKDYLKEKGGRLTEEETLKIMKPVLEALVQVHKSGIIHRDISPDNIMLTFEDAGQASSVGGGGTSSGRNHNKIESVKLIDFGAARMTEKNDQKSLTIILKHGYAPEEQYRTHGEQGPWTDVYALCAVLYRMLTGGTPVPAMDRMFQDELKSFEQHGAKVSANTAAAILKGLAVKKDDRIQSVQELISYLYGSEKVKSGKKNGKKADKKPLMIAAGAAIACLAAVVVIGGLGKTEETAGAANTGGNPAIESNVAVAGGNEAAVSETEAADEMISFNDAEEEIGEQIAFYHPQRGISSSKHLVMCLPDGSVRAFGDNDCGQCNVEDWDHVVRVEAGPDSSIGVREDGTVLFAGLDHRELNLELWTDILDVQCIQKIGVLGLKKDGTVEIAKHHGYLEYWDPVFEETLLGWTDIKAIASDLGFTFGLKTDGTLIGCDEDGNEYSETGWEKAECIDLVETSSGIMIIGLCEEGSVLTYDLYSYTIDGVPSDEFKRFVDGEKVAQVFNRVIVTQDGNVKMMEGREEEQRRMLEGWTEVQCVGKVNQLGYYYGLKIDGTFACSMENTGNTDLREFANLEWIEIATEEAGAETIIGFTKDGDVLAYGSSEKLYRTMAAMTMDSEALEQRIMHESKYDRKVAWYQDAEIYDLICAGAAKIKQFDIDREFGRYMLVQEDGTAAFSYMQETHNFTNVKQISGSNDCLILKSDGTIEIFDYEGNGPLEESAYKYLKDWTDVDYVVGGVGNAIGVKHDGTLLFENGQLDSFSPVKRLVRGTYGTLCITEEETVEIIGVGEGEWLQVDGWTNVKDLAIGDGHVVALLNDGTVRAVGQNNQGQCDVEEWADVEKIYAGSECTLGIDKNGDLLFAGIVY